MAPYGRTAIPTEWTMWLAVPLLGVALHGEASASGLQAKTDRELYPARQVERPLVLAKGWLQVGLGSAAKVASGQWSSEGTFETFASLPAQPSFTHTTQHLTVAYGLTRHGEVTADFRTHWVSLGSRGQPEQTTQFGLGDPRFGYRWELYRSLAPLTSIVAVGEVKLPTGNQAPGSPLEGQYAFDRVVLSTGTPDLKLGLEGKRQLGPTALSFGAAWVRRFSGVVDYNPLGGISPGTRRFKPGDLALLDAGLTVQLGPVALFGGADFLLRQQALVAPAGASIFDEEAVQAMEETAGWGLDLDTGARVHVSRGVDLTVGALVPLKGEDRIFYPAEDLTSTYGVTYKGALDVRF